MVGGGYTGMWAAYRMTELEPGARIVLLESDICGSGPSGRNGGFVTNWWDEIPTLTDRYGETGALAMGHAMESAVDEIGAWCDHHGVDAWFTRAGSLGVSAAEEVGGRVRSPVFRGGVFMPGAATIQPAALARGLRRVQDLAPAGIPPGPGVTLAGRENRPNPL